MQGKARTAFRSLDWTRQIKQAAIDLIAQAITDERESGDNQYQMGYSDGVCEMLRRLSPEVADELINDAIDQANKEPS